MYGSHFLHDQVQQEADLYDHLSLFIKTYKKIMTLSHQIMQRLDDPPPPAALTQLKNIPSIHLSLAEQYNQDVQDHSPNKKYQKMQFSTINRFICRLYETLCLYKSSNYQRSKAAGLYRQFLDKNEQVITGCQSDRNVGKMYKKLMQITEKFCQSCEIIISNGFQEEVVSFFSKDEEKQSEQQALMSPLISRKSSPYKSESNFHKAMAVLNKRFNTLSCLDLDYNSYKSYYFQSRSQKQDIYKDYLQRNALTWKYINSYSKQFSDYIRKKQKISLNRKNRFKQKLETVIKSQADINRKAESSKNIEEEEVKGNCFTLKNAKETQLPALYKAGQKGDSPQRKLEFGILKEAQIRKTQYNIKNVYLTLNKVNLSNKSDFLTKDNKTLPKKKDKYQQYSSFKVGKISQKTTKFNNQIERIKPRPLLQIRQIQSRDYGYTLENSMVNDTGIRMQQSKQHPNPTKRMIAQKKCIRLNQLLSKNSFNTKLHKAETLNDDDLVCNFRVINCEEEELSQR